MSPAADATTTRRRRRRPRGRPGRARRPDASHAADDAATADAVTGMPAEIARVGRPDRRASRPGRPGRAAGPAGRPGCPSPPRWRAGRWLAHRQRARRPPTSWPAAARPGHRPRHGGRLPARHRRAGRGAPADGEWGLDQGDIDAIAAAHDLPAAAARAAPTELADTTRPRRPFGPRSRRHPAHRRRVRRHDASEVRPTTPMRRPVTDSATRRGGRGDPARRAARGATRAGPAAPGPGGTGDPGGAGRGGRVWPGRSTRCAARSSRCSGCRIGSTT